MMKDDDFKLLSGFEDEQTDKRMNERTLVNVESLSLLKILTGVVTVRDWHQPGSNWQTNSKVM